MKEKNTSNVEILILKTGSTISFIYFMATNFKSTCICVR